MSVRDRLTKLMVEEIGFDLDVVRDKEDLEMVAIILEDLFKRIEHIRGKKWLNLDS